MDITLLFSFLSLVVVIGSVGAAVLSTKFSKDAIPFISSVTLSSGVFYTFVGLTNMLANLDDPSMIHTAVFIATLSTIYAGLIWVLLRFLQARITPVKFDFEPIRSRLGALLWIGLFLGSILHENITIFMNIWAFIITTVCLGLIFISAILNEESSLHKFVETTTSYLPTFGHIVLWSSVIMLIPQSDPKKIGPIIAVGFLTYIYTHAISISLALLFPQKTHVTTEFKQWLQVVSGISGAIGTYFFIIHMFN